MRFKKTRCAEMRRQRVPRADRANTCQRLATRLYRVSLSTRCSLSKNVDARPPPHDLNELTPKRIPRHLEPELPNLSSNPWIPFHGLPERVDLSVITVITNSKVSAWKAPHILQKVPVEPRGCMQRLFNEEPPTLLWESSTCVHDLPREFVSPSVALVFITSNCCPSLGHGCVS